VLMSPIMRMEDPIVAIWRTGGRGSARGATGAGAGGPADIGIAALRGGSACGDLGA
jgi:hypothetical protein